MVRNSDRFMDTETFKTLNERAIERGYSRCCDESIYDRLDPEGWHTISAIMFVENGVTRAYEMLVKFQGEPNPIKGIVLDMYHEDYDNLMTWKQYGPAFANVRECTVCGFNKPFAAAGDYMCWDCRRKIDGH